MAASLRLDERKCVSTYQPTTRCARPIADRLFPDALEVIVHAKQWGAALLTDGDVVFQPHKVDRSGLSEAVAGQVLIYLDKEKELDDVAERCPAEHYVSVEDK